MFTILSRRFNPRCTRSQPAKPSTTDAVHLRAIVEAIGGDPDDISPEGARD